MPTTDIRAWHIYHIPDCRHAKPDPKDKFVIVVCVNEDHCLGFFINSRISGFIRDRTHLLGCQTSILSSEHDCLSHDSFIDTTTVLKLDFVELTDMKDEISDDTKRALIAAVDFCIVIPKRYKRQVLDAGRQYFGDEDEAI